MYVIRKIGAKIQYFVDRNKSKDMWWSEDLDMAFVFVSRKAAKNMAAIQRFGTHQVVTLDSARKFYNITKPKK